MKHKLLFKRFVERIVNLVVKYGKDTLVHHHASDEVILAAIQADGGLSEVHAPLAYVNFLRECIEPLTFAIREIKGKEDFDTLESKRFITLLSSLQSGVPPVDFYIRWLAGYRRRRLLDYARGRRAPILSCIDDAKDPVRGFRDVHPRLDTGPAC